jgi:hypothetical protein
MPHALTIWSALVLLVLAGCGAMTYPAVRLWYHRARARTRAVRFRRVHLAAQAEELCRYAGEVAVAAARAAVAAQRWQEEWEAVDRARTAAWRAFLAADASARRTAGAAAYPLPRADADPDAGARYLRRAATAAYRRGQLTVADLNAVLSHAGAWDPRRHPADHEVALRRLARDRLWASYRSIAEIERSARHRAEVADAAARSLRDEAFAAALRADQAQRVWATGPDPRAIGVRAGHRPVPAPGW